MTVEIGFQDHRFAAFARARNAMAADLTGDDSFIPPLFEHFQHRLASYPDLATLPYGTLSIGILDRPSPNAFADEFGSGCCLGIHTGLLISIAETAALLRDGLGAFSSDFGKVGLEVPTLHHEPLGVRAFLSIRSTGIFDEALLGEVPSADDLATRRGMSFISCALQFALLHEFGHVAHGHLQWLGAQGLSPRLEEVDEPNLDNKPQWTEVFRYFEHEADVWALQVLIESIIAGQNIGKVAGIAAHERLVLLLTAFLTLTLTWTELEHALGRSPASRHPDGLKRQTAMTLAIMNVLEKKPAAERQIADALRRSKRLVSALAVRHSRFGILSSMFESSAVLAADAVRRSMQEIAISTFGEGW